MLVRLCLLVAAALVALAQDFRATLQGTVVDPAGAAVAGAEVTLRNTDTGVGRHTIKTDENGDYLFQFLNPGNYQVTVKTGGFKTLSRGGIQPVVTQTLREDLTLALGDATETVEVNASVGTVETDTTSLGTAIRQEIRDNLPLKGRSSLFMFTLTPGVVNKRYGEDTRPNDTITNVLFSANGAPVAATDVFVDGAANTVNVNRGVNISQWVPAVDSIGQFKLENTLFLAGAGTQRPNVAGDPNAGISGSVQDRLLRYFNTAAFAQPPNFTLGNAPARTSYLRSPGMNNWNLTLTKTFSITEQFKVNLRGSPFNLMNTPVFGGPNTTFGVAQFGRISSQANISRQHEIVLKVLF